MVCKLYKSIYGLKQTSHSWNKHFDQTVKSFDFNQNEDELYVYKKVQEGMVVFMVLYVNDILFIGNDVVLLSSIKIWLSTQFSMKDLGEVQCILGSKVLIDCKNRKLTLSQATYIEKLLVKHVIQDEILLSQDQCLKTPEEKECIQTIYYVFSMGSLMYAMLCIKLDICFIMGIVSRYQSRSKTLDNCQAYTKVFQENGELYAYVRK